MSTPKFIVQNGLNEADEIDLLYMILTSLQGICAKLDADVLVTDTDYEALCYTAIINTIIYDSTGHMAGQKINDFDFNIIGPGGGMSDRARNAILFQLFTAFGLLVIKADADVGSTLTTTVGAYFNKWRVQGYADTYVGSGAYTFTPNGTHDQKELVDLYYAFVKSIEDITEALDALGALAVQVTDTDYEALWYTANITITVTDSTGHTAGN